MKLVYVHNTSTFDAPWHQTEQRPGSPVPLRRALCGAVAEAPDGSEFETWLSVWKRAIDPPGAFCEACDTLAASLFGVAHADPMPVLVSGSPSTDDLLFSVFGNNELSL